MNSRTILSLLFAIAILVLVQPAVTQPALAQAAAQKAAPALETWQIDEAHSSAQFAVRHMMVSTVRGSFGKVTGTVKFDAKNLEASSVEAAVDVQSIDTRQAKRDEHLKSPDFFDVAKYPSMTFKSTKITAAGAGQYKMTGALTIHGVTKTVTFDVEGPAPAVADGRGGKKSGATATAKINRSDFGLTWNRAIEAGGVAVSDEVTLTIDIQLNQSKSS